MAREPQLAPLQPGNLAIHAEHFRRVVRRIETIKPIPGDGIIVKEKDGGTEISVDPKKINIGGANGTGSWLDCLKIIELDVCKNGAPSTVYVAGFNSEAELELCGEGTTVPSG